MDKNEIFIEKARKIHGDKYNYSKVEYIKSSKKVCIICPVHGEFWQTPNQHLNGQGCAKCSGNYHPTNEEYISSLKEKYPDTYLNFDKISYKNIKTPVIVTCPEHGDFEVLPLTLENNLECPECQKLRLRSLFASTIEQFIEKAKEIHGEKYDYSQAVYINKSTKIKIICPEHGEFWQTPANHLQGRGCVKCCTHGKKYAIDYLPNIERLHPELKPKLDNNNQNQIILTCPIHGEYSKLAKNVLRKFECPECRVERLRNDLFDERNKDFIRKAKEIHGDVYDYTKTKYKGFEEKLTIICPKHGEFEQQASVHLAGCGCPECGNEKLRKVKVNEEHLIKRFKEKHGDKYDYSNVKYEIGGQKVEIICKKHGSFWQVPYSHMHGAGCPICASENSTSESEIEFRNFISKLYEGRILPNDRTIIRPREIDIYLPEINVAFEYNGLYWHSAEKLHNNLYHQMKMKMCLEKGVTLYQFFEDEWLYKPDAVKSFVKRVLEVPMIHIEANACDFLEINKDEATVFIQNDALVCNNIEYNAVYGLYFQNTLQSVALVNETDDYVEIMGVHDRNETIVDGAFDRVVSELKRLYSSKIMYVRVDRRLDNVQKYLNKGFVFVEEFLPDYNYVVRDFRIPKNNIEEFLENNERVLKIYDCGAERLRLVN
jgi:hypothetical protein